MRKVNERRQRAEVRQRRKGVTDEAAMFRRCLDHAQDFMMSYAAYEFPSNEIVELAAMRYGPREWEQEGLILSPSNHAYRREQATRFFTYAHKTVYNWKAGHDREGKPCRKLALLKENRTERDKTLGIWVGNPEARMLELQGVISRNRGTDDKTVVSALRVAADMGVETSKHTPVDAVRSLVDVAADKRQMFIVHMPKPKQPKP